MPIHAWMLTSLMLGAAPGDLMDTAPGVHLQKDLEINWRGTFSEAILRPNVRAFRIYDVETWAFVVDSTETGADVALFTSITLRPDVRSLPRPRPIVRLELCRVDPTGKMSMLPPDSLSVPFSQRKPIPLPLMPMEGLPTFETSLFVNLPAERLRLGQTWSIPEPRRPPIVFRLEGIDSVRGSRCFKVGAIQQTDDWDNPHAQASPWRRGETILISARHGYTARVERVIEKRDPQSTELAFRSRLVCELTAPLPYSHRLGDERREEIAAAAGFAADFERLVPDAGRIGEQPFEQLIRRIDQHASSHAASESVPYRQASMLIRRKAEAAKRGDIPPAPPPPETTEKAEKFVVAAGVAAPDFITTDLTSNKVVSLSRLRGLPTVLIWYQPGSERTAGPVLQFAEAMYEKLGNKAYILPMAIGDGPAALRQRNEMKLDVHVLAGRDVNKSHGITTAPYFEVIDKEGTVQFVTVGWSDDNAKAVHAQLQLLVK